MAEFFTDMDYGAILVDMAVAVYTAKPEPGQVYRTVAQWNALPYQTRVAMIEAQRPVLEAALKGIGAVLLEHFLGKRSIKEGT